jgi:hypothetical protein
MSLLAVLFAQFGLPQAALMVLRVIAAIGGAFVGWFLSDPLARISYRLVAHKPIAGWTLPWIKMSGAVLVALLVYFFIPLGGGSGGWGFGPGLGGGPGLGHGEGGKDKASPTPEKSAKVDKKTAAEDKAVARDKRQSAVVRKPVEIEVLGAKRYQGEERYYLLRANGKALNLKEVEAYFKEHRDTLELHVVLTDDSPDEGLGIVEDLTRLASRLEIPSLVQRPKRGE